MAAFVESGIYEMPVSYCDKGAHGYPNEVAGSNKTIMEANRTKRNKTQFT